MSADVLPYLGAVAVATAAAATWAARLAPTARPSGTVPFTEPEPGVRYLRCDSPHCAHKTYPHLRQADGIFVCSNCGGLKGAAA
ncbi:hypothetical protein EES45_23135 [Streptomyces sp. ADI97-07]|uniref:hypothetical protein n=1 Tax=Streptomyces sp. ADI97-07 TaxID=1522762 RepID=UPI000F54F370|nr:hypothetical protein [Streptomyces sp. ADI97-07]RPK76389.1 hypothetical protein EES45_23135 [Streptomyces sp. ADI97-07]